MAGNFNIDRLFRIDETNWELGWREAMFRTHSITSLDINDLVDITVDVFNIPQNLQYAQQALYDAIVEASRPPKWCVSDRERVSECNEVSTELNEFLRSVKIISDEQR